MKRILPLFDRVLVQRVKAAERTKAGLFIPEKAQETLNEGVVLAVGPGTMDKDGNFKPCALKEGDRILLPPYGGNNVKIDQNEYTIYKDSEILAKLADK